MEWMISANGKIYDYAKSFATNGFVDWTQRAKYELGDIVFIYCTAPFQKVMYKCEVIEHSKSFSDCIDDATFWKDMESYESSKKGKFVRLKLLNQVDSEKLSFNSMKNYGLKWPPQGPLKVKPELLAYIESNFNDYFSEGYFPDVPNNEDIHEGHTKTVNVNVYERSSIARGKCIEYHGSSCLICGLNFEDKYGELGKGFIHVHHLRPLHTIKEDYVVDYKTDLIPVCPNCHAMIHRIPGEEKMSVADLINILNKKCE